MPWSKASTKYAPMSRTFCFTDHFPQNCEWRISIYGRNVNEWDKLAKWVINNKLFSHNVRWLVQIPRLYDMFKQSGAVQSFEDIIRSECNWLPTPTLSL